MVIATHDPRVHQFKKRIVQLGNNQVIMDTDPSLSPVMGGVS